MKTTIRIRGIIAECGERSQGFVTIGETASGPIQLPVVIVNGTDDGPILCLTSGVHATEYAPIDAVMRIVQSIDPSTLRGAVIAVPVVNLRMFDSRTGLRVAARRSQPQQGRARVAPTARSPRSSRKFCSTRSSAAPTYHIDLHAGDLGEMLLPFAGYALTGKRELDEQGEALARLYSPKLISLADSRRKDSPIRRRHRLRGNSARRRVDLRRVGRQRHAGGSGRTSSRRWRHERHALSSHDRRSTSRIRAARVRRAIGKSYERRVPVCCDCECRSAMSSWPARKWRRCATCSAKWSRRFDRAARASPGSSGHTRS